MTAMSTLIRRVFVRSEPTGPRDSLVFLHRLRAQKTNPSVSEQLDAIAKGMAWSAQDPFLWERRATPMGGESAEGSRAHLGGHTVPYVKIGRR